MNDPSNKTVLLQPPEASPAAIVGTIFSCLGFVGWLTVFGLFQPYEQTRSGINDEVHNVVTFGFNFIWLMIGGCVSGAFSISGLITGAVSVTGHPHVLTYVSVGLGIAGIVFGIAIFAWRYSVILGY